MLQRILKKNNIKIITYRYLVINNVFLNDTVLFLPFHIVVGIQRFKRLTRLISFIYLIFGGYCVVLAGVNTLNLKDR